MTDGKKPEPTLADLLKQADSMQAATDKAKLEAKKAYKRSALGQTHENISRAATAFNRAAQTVGWLYENVVQPVAHVTEPYLGWAWRRYAKLWNRVTMVKDEFGDEQFSKKRAGMMVIGTLAATIAAPTVVTETAAFTWEAGWMASTYHHSDLYLSNAQEIDHANDLWSVTGCEQLPCTDENSIYFRIQPSLLHNLWSLGANHNLFFADNVAGAIPQGVSKCSIGTYGLRGRFLVRNLQWYPQLMRVNSCTPVVTGP